MQGFISRQETIQRCVDSLRCPKPTTSRLERRISRSPSSGRLSGPTIRAAGNREFLVPQVTNRPARVDESPCERRRHHRHLKKNRNDRMKCDPGQGHAHGAGTCQQGESIEDLDCRHGHSICPWRRATSIVTRELDGIDEFAPVGCVFLELRSTPELIVRSHRGPDAMCRDRRVR